MDRGLELDGIRAVVAGYGLLGSRKNGSHVLMETEVTVTEDCGKYQNGAIVRGLAKEFKRIITCLF